MILKGRRAILEMRVDEDWFPCLCAIESSFQFDHEEVLTTSRNSGKFREREAWLCDWSFSLTGLTKIDNEEGQLSFFYMTQAGVRGEAVRMRLTWENDDGDEFSIEGDVLVKQGSLVNIVDGFCTGTLNFPGTGAFTSELVADPEPQELKRLYLSTTPGEHTVSHADLIDVPASQILQVVREDADYIPTLSEPTGKYYRFTSGTGTLEFNDEVPFESGEIVYVLYLG